MRKYRNATRTPVPAIYFDTAAGWRFLPNRAARRSAARRSYMLEAYILTSRLGAAVSSLLAGAPDEDGDQ